MIQAAVQAGSGASAEQVSDVHRITSRETVGGRCATVTSMVHVAPVMTWLRTQAVQWLKQAGDQSIKDALKATTEEAVERGAFGAPTWFVYSDEETRMFFGSDRFEMLAWMYKLPWHGPRGPPDADSGSGGVASGAGGAGAGSSQSKLTSRL